MYLFNTMSRKKEAFIPAREGQVSLYACGITAYDYCHIGHARSAVVFDVLTRYLRYLGYDVTFVRNFTDVDDKIINRANKEGVDATAIAQTYMAAFHEDMDTLNVQRATMEPRATDYIHDMIDLCQRLIVSGNAYSAKSTEMGDDVYFRVRSFPSYGKLSGRDVDDLRAGARVAVGEEKEDPLDFALWKAAKPGEPFWESPWGKGRPGWHIECSAMSEKNLPLPLDIHGGGQDLVFPHHENEIAQSEAALGKTFANYWVHNGFVQIDSEKMSKSLGNFKTIRDILHQRLPEVLRFFLLSKHYRSPIDFAPESMDEAERGLKRIYECLENAEHHLKTGNFQKGAVPPEIAKEYSELDKAFFAAMDDDLNTAAALGHVFGMVRLVNRLIEEKPYKKLEGAKVILESFVLSRDNWAKILGIFLLPPTEFLASQKAQSAARLGIDIREVERLLANRQLARSEKDFAKADACRVDLAALGVEVRDTPGGQQWDIPL